MKLRLPSRLSWKLLAAIIPPVVLAISAIVWLQYHWARREILASINREAASLAKNFSADIDGLMAQRKQDLETLAETPLIADYYRNVDFGLLAEADAHRRELERYFKRFQARTSVYSGIAYVDAKGAPVAGVGWAVDGEISARARKEARAGLWISPIWAQSGGGQSIYFAKSIMDDAGRFKGLLMLGYDLSFMRERLSSVIVGRRGRAYVQENSGQRVEGRPAPAAGLELLRASAPLRSHPWIVTVEAPLDDFLGPLQSVRNAALLTSLLGLGVLVCILLLLVRSITRPIAVLAEAAGSFGAGDFSRRIKEVGGDELGTLAGAFNEMGERLERNRRQTTELQSQLIQSEKLSAIGQLISAVAHELNNPLGAISGFVQLAQLENYPQELRRDLEHVYANVQRCRKVVDNLLFFVRKSRSERERVDLNAAAESALELLEYRLLKTDDVKVAKIFPAEAPQIVGDYQQIVQILINLINNASDAMASVVRYPEGKKLSVTVGLADSRAFIRVSDNGPGIEPEVEEKLFEPFFTTKEPGHGTGLGLSICRQIAREHGGDISIENRPGKGCAFVLDLPLGSEEEFERLDRRAEPVRYPAVPGKRVLVADDEEDITEVIARILREDGDEAIVARGGREALSLLETEAFDLVISDMEMEQVKGGDVYEKVKGSDRNSRARLLFVTGDILNPQVLSFLSKTKSEYLAKPFDIDDLRQAVRRLLGAGLS